MYIILLIFLIIGIITLENQHKDLETKIEAVEYQLMEIRKLLEDRDV